MTPEQERWAEALAIERRFGEQATEHIAERVTALAAAGDDAGIARWIAITELAPCTPPKTSDPNRFCG
ncbi:hypothetical protein K3M67_20250 (plasmid) [Sphingobium sp. V4]|uniref:DUF6961 family protein n=1 Tax=Sphingobium sp. V4 TaxID=3038927 RepID=UPI002557CB18|nr:hypothetical protein [Sphingobium sp. V4]WIW90364.1 hypothetical protein K3M67_20250 [Sphingobium sp. V4]